jgi:hypothetical protein
MKAATSLRHPFRTQDWFLGIVIFFIALFPRIFLYHTEFWRTPDGIEYINVAKNINNGMGLTKSIKMSFYDTSPVITSALQGQPVFTSVIFSLLLRLKNDVYFLQAFGLFIMCINSILFYFLARHFFTAAIALTGGILFATNPNILITNRLVLSEPIFMFFVFVFFLLYYKLKRTSIRYFLLGGIACLAYLTRTEGVFLLFILILLESRKDQLVLFSLLSFFIVGLPYFFLNYQINHNPFYTFTSYHFRVHYFSDFMWDGYGKSYPSPFSFISQNLSWVSIAIIRMCITNIKSILGFGFLSLLSILYLSLDKKLLRKYSALLLFSLFDFATYSIIWSQFAEPERHLMPIFPLLLLPLGSVWKHLSFRKFALLLFSLTMVLYILLDVHRIQWANATEPHLDNWGYGDKKATYEWIQKNTAPQSIIATSNPPLLYLFTERPVVLLPHFSSKKLLQKFIAQYHVTYVLVHKSERTQLPSNAQGVYQDASYTLYRFN